MRRLGAEHPGQAGFTGAVRAQAGHCWPGRGAQLISRRAGGARYTRLTLCGSSRGAGVAGGGVESVMMSLLGGVPTCIRRPRLA